MFGTANAGTTVAGDDGARFRVELTRDAAAVLEAQRLRFRVYRGGALGLDDVDRDDFDEHCAHLIVRDTDTDAIVGTYRILDDDGARLAGGFYSQTEFDIGRIRASGARIMEIGRACVHPAYRGGTVIALLLSGLAATLVASGCEYAMGCASIPIGEAPQRVAALSRRLVAEYACPEEWRAFPRSPFPLSDAHDTTPARMPPLIKSYLKLGVWICSEPAWDRTFATADLLVLLPMARMSPRYRARLLRHAA